MTIVQVVSLAHVSPFPAGRTRDDGPYSGEQFREDILIPALANGPVLVKLDHDAGLPVSFLEEGFGGLVRRGYSEEQLKSLLEVRAEKPALERYVPMIWKYIHSQAAITQTSP